MTAPRNALRTALAAAISMALGAGLSANASAQAFPSKPIRIIVPFAAGGSVDALGRLISPKMTEALGQPVIVENRPGAGATIGADAVAKAAPDGHAVLLIPNALAIMPALFRKLPFDAAKDFAPVTQLVATELILVGGPKLQASTLKEMIAVAKAKPGSMNFGSTGVANPLHLTMEMLKAAAGIDVVPIPYKGDAPLNTALLSGEVELAVLPLAAAQALVRAGKLKALGMTSIKRSQALPNVPTIAENGFAGFDSTSWQSLFTTAGTPRDVVQRLYVESVKALNAPDVREKLPALGQEAVGSTPAEFEARYKGDIERFARIVRDAKIAPQD